MKVSLMMAMMTGMLMLMKYAVGRRFSAENNMCGLSDIVVVIRTYRKVKTGMWRQKGEKVSTPCSLLM